MEEYSFDRECMGWVRKTERYLHEIYFPGMTEFVESGFDRRVVDRLNRKIFTFIDEGSEKGRRIRDEGIRMEIMNTLSYWNYVAFDGEMDIFMGAQAA